MLMKRGCARFLDNTPAVISLKDLHGRYVLVNRGWEGLYDVKNEQIVGPHELRPAAYDKFVPHVTDHRRPASPRSTGR